MAMRNVLGPLTTTFSPPPACTVPAIDARNIGDSGTAWVFEAQGCTDSSVVQDVATCWPSATVTAPSPPFNGWGFYSPGLLCPAGYTTACGATALSDGSQQGAFNFQFPLTAGETAAGCCPSGYTCFSQSIGQTCITTATTGTYDVGVCNCNTMSMATGLPIPGVWSAGSTSGSINYASLAAPLIQINWKEDDRYIPAATTSTPLSNAFLGVSTPAPSKHMEYSTFATSSTGSVYSTGAYLSDSDDDDSTYSTTSALTTTKSGTAEISILISTVISTINTSPPVPSPDAGLSMAAKAGIAVGTAVAVLMFLGCLLFCIFMWKRRKRALPMELDSAELKRPPVEMANNTLKRELAARMLAHELDSRSMRTPVELPDKEVSVENPG